MFKSTLRLDFLFYTKDECSGPLRLDVLVRDGHGGGWSRKINAWHLYTLMVYL